MKTSPIGLVVLMVLLSLGLGVANGANNWPTWRGPDLMGVAPEGNPPLKWSETENVKWKVKLVGDASNSSPIIWGDQIFFQTAVDTGIKDDTPLPQQEMQRPNRPPRGPGGEGGRPGERPGPRPGMREGRGRGRGGRPGGGRGPGGFGRSTPTTQYKFNLVCLNRQNGEVLWEDTVCQLKPHQGHHRDHGFASFSPVTDGEYIWASFGSRGLYCYDLEGKQIWSKELPQLRTVFGEAGSLTLAGDAVIVVCDQQDESFIFAFDKKTGKLLWKKAREEDTSYATPFPVKVNGKLQVIASATDRVRAYDVQTGNVIWECGGQTRNVVPTPVAGYGMVYCASGFRGSALQAIKLVATGDLTDSDAIAWQVNEATPYVPSLLLYEGRIYACSVNKEIVSCYDAKTGKAHFVKQTLDGVKGIYASPTAAGGRIYFVGRNGVTNVLKPSDSFEILAVNTLNDKIDCSPAFVGDEMYLKGKEYLYCIVQ